jgi:UDP-N-acetylglucosamine 2-epimerase
MAAFGKLGQPLIFPCHPRTAKRLAALGMDQAMHPEVHIVPPVGYLDMLMLEQNARIILTDSGGVQKEAFFLGVPCVTLRDTTEWVETVAAGWNTLAGADTAAIVQAVRGFEKNPPGKSAGIRRGASRKIARLVCGR